MLFGADPTTSSPEAFEVLEQELAVHDLPGWGMALVDVMVEAGVVASKGEARRAISEGGVYLDGRRVTDADRTVDADLALHGRYVLLRRGKRSYHLLRAASGA